MPVKSIVRRVGVAACLLAAAGQATAKTGACDGPNHILDALYRDSKPQDAAGCAMVVEGDAPNKTIRIVGPTSNPAMTCPDMVAWKLFAESIQASFWKNWASDQQTWPNSPLALCKLGAAADGSCCVPDAASSNPGYDAADASGTCPFFPGAKPDSLGAKAVRIGQPPSKAHATRFGGEPLRTGGPQGVAAEPDPGRKFRQSMAELVFRNRPMFDFIFKNDLYHQQGLQAVFQRVSDYATAADSMPYRQVGKPGALVDVDFPVDSVMIKSNWLNAERAKELGLRDDEANPYIKMQIKTAANDNNADIFKAGEHWLVAFHISSKDTPNWHWATFEHVNNPGRCDYTGCNDSYGYATSDTGLRPDQATNFTRPKTTCDKLPLAEYVYQTGEPYPGGTRSQALGKVLTALGIGTDTASQAVISAGAKAWNSYRLKGTQTEFTSATGQATRLGNSVTEGGFVNSSSCITCHARASIDAKGTNGSSTPLSVFMSEASESGYLRSANGVPDPNWYATSRQPATPLAVQTDFVWGFLFAKCIPGQVTSGCPAKANAGGLRAGPPEEQSIRSLIRR